MKKAHVTEAAIIFILMAVALFHLHVSGGPTFDNTPPVTEINFTGPFYEKGGEKWVTNQTLIWLNATDDISGVNATYYRIWHNGAWHPFNESDYYCGNHNITFLEGSYWYVYFNETIDFKPIHFCEECGHGIEYYSVDKAGNIESHGMSLIEEWNYTFQPNTPHLMDKIRFGSSPAISNLTGNKSLEIFTGSDEAANYYPELGGSARGIWRCFDEDGNIVYVLNTQTDEARSSPAIADIDGDGIKEIVAGTTSGWFLEVIEEGHFEWTFPSLSNGPEYLGYFT